MQWQFTKNTTRYALVGDHSRALLAAKSMSPTGVPGVTPLGWSDRPLSKAKSIHQMMANISHQGGDVFISLPLDHFEILNLSINRVPREVIDKILPYHIEKVFDEPLSDFIYDWQVVKELKDSLQLNVFLFPAKMFQELRSSLGHYKLTPATLEPDIFSACAFLESRHLLQPDESAIIALLWPKSISIAIWDNENLVLARNIQLPKPEQRIDSGQEVADIADKENKNQVMTKESASNSAQPYSLFEPNPDDLLANFLVQTKEGEDHANEHQDSPFDHQDIFDTTPAIPLTDQSLPAYVNQVSLELMRTRDYFNSVIKGNQVKTVFIGGSDEASWQHLSSELESTLGLSIQRLMNSEDASFEDALFEAVTIGVSS